MSWSYIPTVNNTGVKVLRTLGSTPDPDTITALVNNGWNVQSVNNLVALGATDEQLLALPFPASETEMRAGYAQLSAQLVASPSTPAAVDAATQTAQAVQQQQLNQVAAALSTNPWTNGVVPIGASGGAASAATGWLTQNAGMILLFIAVIALAPPLIKKL